VVGRPAAAARPTTVRADPSSVSIPVRVEILFWSLLARVLVRRLSLERSLRLLDRLPHRARSTAGFAVPPERTFRGAGACLGRSLARSQFLRVRGHSHAVVIGVRGGTTALHAHAWVEPCDPVEPSFVELRRIAR